MWRPEKNWDARGIVRKALQSLRTDKTIGNELYTHLVEAGADAILEAIKEFIDPEDVEAYGSQCGKCLKIIEES